MVDRASVIEDLTENNETFRNLLKFVNKCDNHANTLYGLDFLTQNKEVLKKAIIAQVFVNLI